MAPQTTEPATNAADPFAPLAMLWQGSDRFNDRMKRVLTALTLGRIAWTWGRAAHNKLRAELTYTVKVAATDRIYDAVHAWITQQVSSPDLRQVTAATANLEPSSDTPDTVDYNDPNPKTLTLSTYYDARRSVTVNIDGHPVRAEIVRDDPNQNLQLRDAERARQWLRNYEAIQFQARGVAGRDAVLGLLEQITEQQSATTRTPSFRVASRWGDWQPRSDLQGRSLDTVVLADGQTERIRADLARFLSQRDEYHRLGIPWHRGILLSGPPGTGKTSLARALATDLRLDMYWVPLSDMTEDATLLGLVSRLESRSLLLLEDIDVLAATHERSGGNDSDTQQVSLSGLLNALDGIATPDGLITIMTTNHPEVLDEALVRPGRADVHEHLGHVTDRQLQRLVEINTGIRFDHRLHGAEIAAAEIVEHLKRHIGDPEAQVAAVETLLATKVPA